MDDLLYFTNYRGAVAVSYDDGETVVIPSGRCIPLTPLWVPEHEDLALVRDSLTLEQRKEVGRALASWDGLVLGLDTAPSPKSDLDLDDLFD